MPNSACPQCQGSGWIIAERNGIPFRFLRYSKIAFPLMLLITSGSDVSLVIGMVLALNIGVLGLFSLESVTMAELFGARTRFTQLALAKEIGGILATAIGPLMAAPRP